MKRQHNSRRALQVFILLLAASGLLSQIAQSQKKVTSPEEFFGFRLGSDRKIARWDKIVDYFKQLETESGRIKVVNMGPSTMGNPFLLVIISAEANLSNLDRLQAVNARLSDPAGSNGIRNRRPHQGGKSGHLPVHEPSRHRDRRHPDGPRTDL